MAQKVINLECPGCGAPISTEMKNCPKCFRPIVITTFNSINGFSPIDLNKQTNAYIKAMAQDSDNKDVNLSIAFCYLKLKLYDKAIPCFEKALAENFNNSEAFFYAAVALLKGKKAFLAQRKTIDTIVEYINSANMIEERGIYYYFLAYIKYDYFKRKALNTSPDYKECLAMASNVGLSAVDIEELYSILGVERPTCL